MRLYGIDRVLSANNFVMLKHFTKSGTGKRKGQKGKPAVWPRRF